MGGTSSTSLVLSVYNHISDVILVFILEKFLLDLSCVASFSVRKIRIKSFLILLNLWRTIKERFPKYEGDR